MTADVVASVKGRLRNKARGEGTDYQQILVRYACERFLYRLGMTEERERCILKGATLLSLWMEDPYRTTRDIDLLATGENDEDAVRRAWKIKTPIVGTIGKSPKRNASSTKSSSTNVAPNATRNVSCNTRQG